MGTAVLNELQDRLYTSAIAGANLLNEDFRLKRALEQFETLSASAPVLKKVYEQVKPVTNPECKEKETALIDAITLVDAVVCTQGSFEKQGEITPISIKKGRPVSPYRYSQLEPIVHALSERGPGRYEIIKKEWDEQSSLLYDFRLKPVLVKALGDAYSEISALVMLILMEEGEEILPFLKEGFDPKGGKEMCRRLQVIEKIAKQKENEFYLGLLENSSPAIKEEAIHALSFDDENVDKLMELIISEKGNTKRSALYSLGRMHSEKAVSYWEKELSKKSSSAQKYLVLNQSDRISDILAEKLDLMIEVLLGLELQNPVENDIIYQFADTLQGIPCKGTKKMMDVLCKLAENGERLGKLKNKENRPILTNTGLPASSIYYYPDVKSQVNMLLLSGMAYTKSEKLIAAVKTLFLKQSSYYMVAGMAAYMLSEPDKAYDTMEKYFENPDTLNQLIVFFSKLFYQQGKGYYLRYQLYEITGENMNSSLFISNSLDIRWFLLFIEHKELMKKHERVLFDLLNTANQEQQTLLKNYWEERAKEGETDLFYLLRCGCKDFKGLIPIKLSKQTYFNFSVLSHHYRNLPISVDDAVSELYQIADMIEQGIIHSKIKNDARRVRDVAKKLEETRDFISIY